MLTSRSYVCCCCEWQYCMLFHYRHTLQHSTQCLPMSCAHSQDRFWTFQCQTHVYTRVKRKPSTQLSADSFSSFIISEHSPTPNTRSTSRCLAVSTAAHSTVSVFFFSTCWRFPFSSPSHPVNSNFLHETCKTAVLTEAWKFKQITQQRKHSCPSKQSWEIKKLEWLTVLLGKNTTTNMTCISF